MKIGVKFCGGCNPRYDRTAMLERFQCRFPELEFASVYSGDRYHVLLVICGCQAQCANLEGLTNEVEPVIISVSEQFEACVSQILELLGVIGS